MKVAGELDHGNLLMVEAYRALLESEPIREAIFAGTQLPQVVGEPDPWLAQLFVSLQQGALDQWPTALVAREQAFDDAPATAGNIDGTPFEWIADADPRFGPCLELVLNGGYYWAPFSRISELKFEAPTDLRDKIWAPVQITWTNGGRAIGFVPTRYPTSERSDDEDVVMARKTDWIDLSDEYSVAIGQRMFATNVGEFSLLDVRQISLTPA